MSIEYITGDATQPQGSCNKIVAHVCNDIGGWGAGFVLAISKRWPEPERDFREWHKLREENDFALGSVRFVKVEKDCWIANMIGQRDIHKRDGIPPIRYDAVEKALAGVAVKAKELNASVHMPRIGCGLAGGKWAEIEKLIERILIASGVDVFVYDLAANK